MKILLALLCVFVLGVTSSAILGKEKCTYGPGYWCSNIRNAKSCGAVKHCIKAVWEKQHVPVDTDSICKICLDMVTQARDQLESNETMEEIREVFDGSCDLIPIKIVKKECKALADDFIVELVEALASEMNPQVVCSTAGLCNNARIDELLKEYQESLINKNQLSCDQCNSIGNHITHKFRTSSRDQVLEGFLGACGRLSSFSDACSSMVLAYFNEIYKELSNNLNSENICHMSGVCVQNFHQHEDTSVEIETKSNVGFLKNKKVNDDVPCELCEQLVKHLRDILIANTTESEFKTVLEGLCNQTKGFKDECRSLVDEYYPIIYETLVNNLDANGACFMIGVCPKGSNMPMIAPSSPFLPKEQKFPKRKLGENEKAIKLMPLPIDRLMGANTGLDLVEGGELCPICQYVLHFIQEELSEATTEDEIKTVVGRVCDVFPKSIHGNCHNFIDTYGDALIALLVQGIDPRDLCPTMKFCPKNSRDVEIVDPDFLDVEVNQESKTSCPLCVLVVKEAENYVKEQKSKETAKKALERVCTKLPPKPQLQCKDFVETYYDELLNKLISDLEPKEICSELKLCPALNSGIFRVGIEKLDNIPYVGNGDVDTNEIPDSTMNGQPIYSRETISSGECTLCEMVITSAEDKVKTGMKKEQVEDILYKECARYRPYESICDNFVKSNTDKIIKLLSQNMAPKQICQQLTLCFADVKVIDSVVVSIVATPAFAKPAPLSDDPPCVLCEFIMTKLEAELKDKTTRDEIRTAVENICTVLPNSISKQCTKFIDEYADLIIDMVDTVPPRQMCQQMNLCPTVKKAPHLVGVSECTWGPSHFCSDHKIAEQCKATEYCKRQKIGMFA